MRKNKLITLLSSLTLAVAGIGAIAAGANESNKAKSVSASTSVDKDCYTFYAIDEVYATNDYRDLKIHMWDIQIDSSMGFDSSNLRADFDSAGCINDFVRASLDASSLVIDSYFDWQKDISTGKEWKITIPWYVTSFKYKLYAGSYWATDGDQTMSTKGYYNIYLCDGTWDNWKTSVVKQSYSSQDNVSQYAISAASNPSGAGSATVEGNGGSPVPSGNYYERQKITAKATANTGYSFSSWSDSGAAEHTFYASEDVALTANFTANTYDISLNANEGTGGPASVTATYGSAMPTLTSLPTRTGYTFDGYYDNATGGERYYNDDGTSAKAWDKASASTLYAHWAPNPKTPYTVNHYWQNTDLSTYTLHETDNLSGPTASQTQADAGFTVQSFSQTTIAPDGSTVININYNRIAYTMSYDLGIKPQGDIPTPSTMYYGCTPNECGVILPDLSGTWDGYTFVGWKYTGQGQDIEITQTTPYSIASNITITAQWEEIVPEVTVTVNNSAYGKVTDVLDEPVTSFTVPYGSEVEIDGSGLIIGDEMLFAVPTDYSAQYTYLFDNWSNISDGDVITEDIDITANFSQHANPVITICSCTGGFIKVDGNVVSSVTVPYQSEVSIDDDYILITNEEREVEIELTAESSDDSHYTYEFTGWGGISEGFITANTELTASFEPTPIPYSITYVTNGGTLNSGVPTSYDYESSAVTLPTATDFSSTPEHKKFDGWYNNADFEGEAILTIPAQSTGDKTFYAKWIAEEKVTISYYADSDLVRADEGYAGDNAPAAPEVPAKAGYNGSWDSSYETFPSSNVTVTAVYNKETYQITFNNGGGQGGSLSATSYQISDSAQTITITDPTKAGCTPSYSVSGATGVTISGNTITIPANTTGNISVTTNWSKVTYNVLFDPGDGTGGGLSNESYQISDSPQTITITDPVLEGYTPSYTLTSAPDGVTINGKTITIPANTIGNIAVSTSWTITPELEVEQFIEFFNNQMKVCDKDGKTNEGALSTAWASLFNKKGENDYDIYSDNLGTVISENAKSMLASAKADPEGTELEKFAFAYNYICGKYNLEDFAGRNPVVNSSSRLFSVSNVSSSTWIIASVAIVGIAAVGVFFIYRKRKEN